MALTSPNSSLLATLKRWPQGMVYLLTIALAAPILIVVAQLFGTSNHWQHLVDTVLGGYLINSAILVLGVAIGTLLLGVPTAWLTAMYHFPGRRWLSWALLLPLAMPAYIIAYTYTGLLDYSGPLQSMLRQLFDWHYGDYTFPDIRTLGGAIIMLSLVLYPYVYLLARAAFLQQSLTALEAAQTLGLNRRQSFFRIAVPMARPAIIAGMALALMETLADYGTVQYFGIDTFTTGIYRTWFGLGDLQAASQLAAMLLLFVIVLLLLEQWSRRHARYHNSRSSSQRPVKLMILSRSRQWLLFALCLMPLLLGFMIPAIQLGLWSVESYHRVVDEQFWALVANTLKLALITALLAVVIALSIQLLRRFQPSKGLSTAAKVVSFGYAVPGAIIAVAVLTPLGWLDQQLNRLGTALFDITPGLLLSGTLFALIFGYLIRFLAVAINSVESGMGKIDPHIDDAARTLGYPPRTMWYRLHLPLLRGSLLTALLLVFVDVMKELPATLVLRPFNFNTLAVRTFELAADERLADSAPSALMIVAAGLIPVVLLSVAISRSRSTATQPITTTGEESR
ncbi:iron ABC transporter permease [Ectothiorhodospiraceae bacterium BW-2]|nr:iron ABC transporter permease [Ectothiorhodospiraceae bacterium BW-2]